MTNTELQYAYAVLGQLNRERNTNGLRSLRMNSHLIASGRAHNLDMAKYNTMSHQLPGEAVFSDRISAAGYNWQWAGENVGWNSVMTQDGALELETIMYNERPPNDGHRQNILNSHYTDIGVDVYFDHVNNKLWLTEDFGAGDSASPVPQPAATTAATVRHGHILTSPTTLHRKTWIRSANKKYTLVFTGHGNLAIRHGKRTLWTTHLRGVGYRLAVGNGGAVKILARSGETVWSTRSRANGRVRLKLSNRGNLWLLDSAGRHLWCVGIHHRH